MPTLCVFGPLIEKKEKERKNKKITGRICKENT